MSAEQIIFTADVRREFDKLKSTQHVVFICDENTRQHCLPVFGDVTDVIVVPAGEAAKNIQTYTYIIEQLIALNTRRSSLIINLGGGVVTDIGGFAASTFMRGIPFIHIPTTLLGMVDAAIGGKTGIDFGVYKNYLGTFHMPEKVWIDPVFLKTLNEEEIRAGKAEMIKCGIIAEQTLFKQMYSGVPYQELIAAAAMCKQAITAEDPRDEGIRQLLNFGHTMGHAFESLRLQQGAPVLHGFAVAKGMMAEARIAHHLNMVTGDELRTITDCIQTITGQQELSANELQALTPMLGKDKKNQNRNITFSLPEGIGKGRTGIQLSLTELQAIFSHA